jgi:hypothetical protein
VRVRVPPAEVATAGVSFWPESRARKVTVGFVVPGVLDVVVGEIKLVLEVEAGEGLTEVEVEVADLAEVDVEVVGSLPSEKMTTQATTAAATTTTRMSKTKPRPRACLLRRRSFRVLGVRYLPGSGNMILGKK